jgi:methyl-accepting chemotaxis protein
MAAVLSKLSPARLLSPGRALMLRLSMRAKLAVVTLAVMLPLAMLVGWLAATGLEGLRQLEAMRDGVQPARSLLVLTQQVQALRTLNHRLINGDQTAAPQRDDLVAAVTSTLARPAPVQAGGAESTRAWAALRPMLTALLEKAPSAGASSVYKAHSDALNGLARLSRLNAEQSGQLLDPDATGYYLVELLNYALPPLIDTVSQVSATGVVQLQRETRTVHDRMAMQQAAEQVTAGLQRLRTTLEALQRHGQPIPGTWDGAMQSAERFVVTLRDLYSRDQPEHTGAAFLGGATLLLQSLNDMGIEAAERHASSVDKRIEEARLGLLLSVGAFVLGLVLALYLFAVLYASFMQSISALQSSTQAVSSGDLSTQVTIHGSDELADIGRTVNGMNDRLSSLVGEIRNSAARVNMAGTLVAEGSQRLSARSVEQASGLRASVVAITQLSSDVQRNAQAARELDELTAQLSRQATDGTQAMGETLAAVQKLQVASRRVFEVVAVIDDVAFQTGMLSLNAAVEAARAGDAGKGFSIVASEVRTLAQRVAESAEEIRSLITLAGDQLVYSDTKLASASQSLEGLASGVQDVSGRLRQISQASTQQSDILTAVAQRVGELDQITCDNARLVDESTVAAKGLVERAQILRDAVSSMRLRQGSADEAREMLDRALDHMAAVGKEQGFKDLHDSTKGFIDRDMYVFALDRDGVYVACGAKPELIGTSVNVLPGIQGTPFVQNAWAAAQAGGGWVQYEIANPMTGGVTPKESYVRQLDESLLLGCGVYRRVQAAAAPPKVATRPPRQRAAVVQAA